MDKPGRPKKYGTAKALREGIDTYWRSISYERPVIVSTPTGAVDENGRLEYTTRMLLVDENGAVSTDGTGKPKTSTEFLEAPSVAGLCLHLGISKETWSQYKQDEKLGVVCQEFLLKLENYLVARLEGDKAKSVQGVIFNLKNNFGWKDKVDVAQTNVGMTVEQWLEQLEKEGVVQNF